MANSAMIKSLLAALNDTLSSNPPAATVIASFDPSSATPLPAHFPSADASTDAKTRESPPWSMDRPPQRFAHPPSHHLAFDQHYDTSGRPLYHPPSYTDYNQQNPNPIPLPSTERERPPFDRHYLRDSLSPRFEPQQHPSQVGQGLGVGSNRKARQRERKRRRQVEQQQQQRGGAGLEYDPYQPGIIGEGVSNANAIQISNARNRLRDRFETSTPRSAAPEPELEHDHKRAFETRPEPEPARQSSYTEGQISPVPRSPQLPEPPIVKISAQGHNIEHMAANGAPPTPTGPSATAQSYAPARTRRLPNHVQIADAYIFQQTIEERLKRIGVTHAREDALRLAGVQWIDQTRRALKLPVRTYATACVYYHKFRLMHGDNEYAFVDASAAALFTACKIEDTLKKSRDILCAAHNAKAPSRADHLSPDDPQFEAPSRTIVGHERLMLESSGFDFRSRHMQGFLVKLLKEMGYEREGEVSKVAWKVGLDCYRTMAPLKMGMAGMGFACVELAERVCLGGGDEKRQEEVERRYRRWGLRREMVVETLLDLLDTYTAYRTSTSLGPSIPLDTFLAVRIPLNEESARRNLPRYTEYIEPKATPTGPGQGGYGAQGGAGVNGAVNGGAGSGRNSAKTSPKEVGMSPGAGVGGGSGGVGGGGVSGAGGVASAGGANQGIRQRASERGREGTVRFMLNPERERVERRVVGEYERGGGR